LKRIKYYLVLILLGFSLSQLQATVVASVGEREIHQSDLTEEIKLLEDEYAHLSYMERREIALERLIEEVLLSEYARENRIRVRDEEVDAYFVAQFGKHPRFSTDGEFDEQKFREQRYTSEVQTILRDLRAELLSLKAKDILKNRFRYSDSDLLDKYILEKTNVSLSYALLRRENINLPYFVTPAEIYSYYLSNREDFPAPEWYDISFYFVPYRIFEDRVRITENDLLEYIGDEVELDAYVRQESFRELKKERVKRLALLGAQEVLNDIASGFDVKYPLYEDRLFRKPYESLNSDGVLMRYNALSAIDSINRSDLSKPIELDEGYLIVNQFRKNRSDSALTPEVAERVWSRFFKQNVSQKFERNYQEYYRDHLYDYIVPAAHITRLSVNYSELAENFRLPDKELRSFYEKNRHRLTEEEQQMPYFQVRDSIRKLFVADLIEEKQEWCKENIYNVGYDLQIGDELEIEPGIRLVDELLFLEKLDNKDELSELVKTVLNNEIESQVGSAKDEENIVYFRVNSFFPAYLPSFGDVQNQLLANVSLTIEEIDYEEYYHKWKNKLAAPDSVKLAGIFVPVNPDTTDILERELEEFYQNNIERYYSDPEIEIEYLYIKDKYVSKQDEVEELHKRAVKGENLTLLNYCVGSILINIPQRKALATNQLPKEINSYLENLPIGKIGSTLYFNDGWFIGRKVKEIPATPINLWSIKDKVEQEYRREKGMAVAKDSAEELFQIVRRVKDLESLEDKSWVFETEKQSIAEEFEKIGDITEFADNIVALKTNERMRTLLVNQNGYGIIFLLDKTTDQTYSFEEALPIIKEQVNKEQIGSNTQNFAENLRELIAVGEEGKETLQFFGKWVELENLSLDNSLPGIAESDLIIEDAIRRKVGYLSHLVELSESEYMFYRVDDKCVVTRDDFKLDKVKYGEEVAERGYRNWLMEYGRERGVSIR